MDVLALFPQKAFIRLMDGAFNSMAGRPPNLNLVQPEATI